MHSTDYVLAQFFVRFFVKVPLQRTVHEMCKFGTTLLLIDRFCDLV